MYHIRFSLPCSPCLRLVIPSYGKKQPAIKYLVILVPVFPKARPSNPLQRTKPLRGSDSEPPSKSIHDAVSALRHICSVYVYMYKIQSSRLNCCAIRR